MLLVLLSRILLWALIGWLIWYILVKFIPRAYLTWFGGFVILALLFVVFVEPNDDDVSVAWQILSLPLRPIGLVIILLLYSMRDGWKKVKPQPIWWATALLMVFSMPLISAFLIGNLERAVFETAVKQHAVCAELCPVQLAPAHDAIDAIVVFTEGIQHIDTWVDPLAQITQSSNGLLVMSQVASLAYAAQLYQDQVAFQGNRPLVFVTGGPPTEDRFPQTIDESDRIVDFLARHGVDPVQVQVGSTGLQVRASVLRLRELLHYPQSNNRPRIIAIAPAHMMQRVGLAFYRKDIRVVARPTEYFEFTVPNPDGFLQKLATIIPSAEALAVSTHATDEYLAMMYYFLRDWIPGFYVTWQATIEVDQRQLDHLNRDRPSNGWWPFNNCDDGSC